MNYCEIMNEVLDLSRYMLEMAQLGNWEEVQNTENVRQALVINSGPLPDDAQDAEAAYQMIRSIMEINEKVLALSKQQLSTRREVLTGIAKGRSAVKAYGT